MTITLQDLLARAKAIAEQHDAPDVDDKVNTLKSDLDDALAASPVLRKFKRLEGRDECALEGEDGPLLQVAYEIPFGRKYATETAFTLRDGEFVCYVRTWFFKNGYDHASNDYELAMNGELDHDAKGNSFEEVIEAAAKQAVEHRVALVEDLGITFTAATRELLVHLPLHELQV